LSTGSGIASATGCCKATASGWRNGRTTPHVSTWPALARLVGVELPSTDGAEVVDLVAEMMRREDLQYDAYLDAAHSDTMECEHALAAAVTQPTRSIDDKEAVS